MPTKTFKFSEEQRDALVHAIGFGAYLGEPMRLLKRFERYAARFHSSVVEPGLTPAIVRVEKITQFISLIDGLDRPDGLWCALEELDSRSKRRVARWLGGEYFNLEDGKGDRVSRGKEVLGDCQTMISDLRAAASYAREKAYLEVWNGEEPKNEEFRRLCLDIANAWYDVSIESLPGVTCEEVPKRIMERNKDDRNVLWVTLDALGIDISDHTLSDVRDYIGRELFGRA